MRNIDHLVHAVRDLDAAAGGYEGLGFTVTPRADHPFGTSNRLVVLDGAYIELVSVTRPDAIPESGFAADVARRLETGEGLSFVVVSSADADADHAELSGLLSAPVFRFARPAPLLGGSTVEASFSCVFLERVDEVGVFLCQHHNPAAVWNRAALTHRNGAARLVSVTLPGREPLLRQLAAAAGATSDGVSVELGDTVVRLGRSRIQVQAARDASLDIGGVDVVTRRADASAHQPPR